MLSFAPNVNLGKVGYSSEYAKKGDILISEPSSSRATAGDIVGVFPAKKPLFTSSDDDSSSENWRLRI